MADGSKKNTLYYKYQFDEIFKFKYVISTLRESYSASHNGWKALIYNGKEFYESKHYDIEPIIDRVGGGDSFGAGLIYSLVNGKCSILGLLYLF